MDNLDRRRDKSKAQAFATAAVAYRAAGLLALPTRSDCKRPAVRWRHYNSARARRPSRETVEKWGRQFPGANLGVVTGPVSGITVVDVDGGAEVANEILELCGDTPIKVRTPSGGQHHWYGYAGEKTIARPECFDGLAADVRGLGGFIAAPPSYREGRGGYTWLEGELAGVNQLPIATNLPLTHESAIKSAATPLQLGPDPGGAADQLRNITLFAEARRAALECGDRAQLLHRIREANMNFGTPLLDAETERLAGSAWRYREEGRLLVPGAGGVVYTEDEYTTLRDDGDALVLFTELRRAHPPRAKRYRFSISPKAMAPTMPSPWSPQKLRCKRTVLIERGLLKLEHQGGRHTGDSSLFAWPGVGAKS